MADALKEQNSILSRLIARFDKEKYSWEMRDIREATAGSKRKFFIIISLFLSSFVYFIVFINLYISCIFMYLSVYVSIYLLIFLVSITFGFLLSSRNNTLVSVRKFLPRLMNQTDKSKKQEKKTLSKEFRCPCLGGVGARVDRSI